jgi:hypothetical protein
MNDSTHEHSQGMSRCWVYLIIVASLISASVLRAARAKRPYGDAVFIGQVLSDGTVSITNVINAERGVYLISSVKVAQVRVESVLNHDQPSPLRFLDEVLVYHGWYMREAGQISTGECKKFYCHRRNLLGRTNVLILSGSYPATTP